MLRLIKWLFHPISLFVIIQICWGLLMFVWIRWYVVRNQEINHLVQKIPIPVNTSGQTVVLVEGCILMGLLLIAVFLIFASQRRLNRLTKMQDAILSSVTHELKTPLASVKLYTETLLMRNVVESDRSKFLKLILNESDRLQKLIDTVLISARLESGKISEAHAKLRIDKLLEDCFLRIKERFNEERNFVFVPNENKEEIPDILGNAFHLSTLFDNLLNNAVKYTKRGGNIILGFYCKKENIIIYLKDDGVGIEKKNLKKIFQKFFRIDSQTTTTISGSGLGLSLCDSIVKEHGGSIYAYSEGLNKGSTFYVEFKRVSPYY